MGIGDDAEGGVYGIVERDGIPVHLQMRRRQIYPDDRQRIETEAYINVDDVDALFLEFERNDARIVRPPVDGPNYDLRDFVVEDIDGNRLIFGSPKVAS